MKVLQDRCIANEGVICWFRKHQEIENKEWDQYKEAIHTLNEELTLTTVKLKEESRLWEEAEKAKTNLEMELVALREEMEKAKANTVAEFQIS